MPQIQPMNWLSLLFTVVVLLPALISMVYYTYLASSSQGDSLSQAAPTPHKSMW